MSGCIELKLLVSLHLMLQQSTLLSSAEHSVINSIMIILKVCTASECGGSLHASKISIVSDEHFVDYKQADKEPYLIQLSAKR
jgi:hypothetical protein